MTEWNGLPRDAKAALLVYYAARKVNYKGMNGTVSEIDSVRLFMSRPLG